VRPPQHHARRAIVARIWSTADGAGMDGTGDCIRDGTAGPEPGELLGLPGDMQRSAQLILLENARVIVAEMPGLDRHVVAARTSAARHWPARRLSRDALDRGIVAAHLTPGDYRPLDGV
jgi:hypothetical protein